MLVVLSPLGWESFGSPGDCRVLSPKALTLGRHLLSVMLRLWLHQRFCGRAELSVAGRPRAVVTAEVGCLCRVFPLTSPGIQALCTNIMGKIQEAPGGADAGYGFLQGGPNQSFLPRSLEQVVRGAALGMNCDHVRCWDTSIPGHGLWSHLGLSSVVREEWSRKLCSSSQGQVQSSFFPKAVWFSAWGQHGLC